MKRLVTQGLLIFTVFVGLVVGSQPTLSAEQTVALNVKMWCSSCPYIVKRTLESVAGVRDVKVSYEQQQAVVRFDDKSTSVAALTKATAGVGFPSTVVSTNQ